MTEYRPPSHPESEAALVGAMLLEPGIIPTVSAVVTQADFFDRDAATLFGVLTDAFSEFGSALDLTMLHEFYRRRSPTQPPPLDKYRDWMTTTGGAAAAPHYARIVAKYARVRRAIEACHIAEHQLTTNPDSDQAVAEAMELVASVLKNNIADDGIQLAAAADDLIRTAGQDGPEMVHTGLAPLDSLLGGFPRSGVVTVLGYPASGKTTAALTAACNRGLGSFGPRQPVRVYSVEQGARRIAASVLTSKTTVPVHSILNSGEPFNAAQSLELGECAAELAGGNIWIAPKTYSAPEIYAQCAAAHAHSGRGCVVVDFIQNLPAFDVYKEDTQRIAASMRVVSDIARDYGWCVIVVSQLGKDVAKANRRPTLADGVGSGVIEQRSDFMLSVWREHQMEPRSQEREDDQWTLRKRKTELAVLKNKYGPTGTATASFNGPRMRFETPTMEESMAWS